jgi:hypothetical protein
MNALITLKAQKIKEGRSTAGRSFRIFVLLGLLFVLLTPTVKASAMADIGGESIYDLFNDKGDDVFNTATNIVKDVTSQIFQLVKYIAVFVFAVALILAAVGFASSRAQNRDKAKNRFVLTILGAVFMFASVGVLTFSHYIANGIAAGIIKSEYESAMSDVTDYGIAPQDYQIIRAAVQGLMEIDPYEAPLKPDSSGYYKRGDIQNWLSNTCIRSTLFDSEGRSKAYAYGEACILLHTGKHHVLKRTGEPYYDYTFDADNDTITGSYFIIDFKSKSIRSKFGG